MIEKTEFEIKESRLRLDKIRCDVCKRVIFTNEQKSTEVVSWCKLVYHQDFAFNVENLRPEPIEEEASDICFSCYEKIKKFLKKLGGKIPSYYVSERHTEEEFFNLLLEADEPEEDEPEENEP